MLPPLPLDARVGQELDFVNEARNCEKCGALLGCTALGEVVVPRVYWALTGTRVLTMSFEEGQSVTDTAYQQRQGLGSAAVASLLSNTFCRMIFGAGCYHSAPATTLPLLDFE